jgi:glutathione S-transferase
MTLKLYFAPGSSAFAPLIAEEELGVAYEVQRVDLAAGEQRQPAYLKVNPRGRVPTLAVNGEPVTEVLAILTYLAQAYPHSELLPLADPLKLAHAYEVMSWFASTVHVAFSQIARPNASPTTTASRPPWRHRARRVSTAPSATSSAWPRAPAPGCWATASAPWTPTPW